MWFIISYDANIIILSTDEGYKSFLAEAFRKADRFKVESDVSSIKNVNPLLSKTRPNVLIIDMQDQSELKSFLEQLIKNYILKIIVTNDTSSLDLLRIGITDIIYKPTTNSKLFWSVYSKDIIKRIDFFVTNASKTFVTSKLGTVDAFQKIIVIASSTGGTEALVKLIGKLPANMPPILIVQHMPAVFTNQFALRLDKLSELNVSEATNAQYLKIGAVLIAPGDLHMKLIKRNSKLAIETFYSDKIHGVRPSADVLFSSVLNIANPKKVIGVILTGMGADGAKGLFNLHEKGAITIAQDKNSSVVFGMPKAAIEMGAIDYILPLDKIADKLIELAL